MPLLTKQNLWLKYKKLPRLEKELIGTALVKVNMGVFLPIDQKRAAAFLKGSEYIAKKGTLDELISLLYSDDETTSSQSKGQKAVSIIEKNLHHDQMKELKEYKEDFETTLLNEKKSSIHS